MRKIALFLLLAACSGGGESDRLIAQMRFENASNQLEAYIDSVGGPIMGCASSQTAECKRQNELYQALIETRKQLK